MARMKARVNGKVSYREGDGMLMEIPHGPCEVTVGELDVTLTWFEDEVACSTAMPTPDYEQYVAGGDLVLQ